MNELLIKMKRLIEILEELDFCGYLDTEEMEKLQEEKSKLIEQIKPYVD